MNSISFFYSVVIALLLFSACSKDEASNTTSSSLIKSLYRDASPLYTSSRTYLYNSKNQLTKIDFGPNQYTEFQYKGNMILEITNLVFAQEIDTNYYFLNSRNLVDSAIIDYEFFSFQYNSDGYLINKSTYDAGNDFLQIQYFTIQNGNLISSQTTWWDSTIVESISYSDFETSHKNTLGNANLGQSYFGKSSEYLAKTIQVFDGSSQTDYYEVPTFDASGRIGKLEHHIDPDPEYIDTYTYY